MNFNHLELKKLICTSYANSPISHTELNDLPLFHKDEKMPYMIEVTEVADYNGDGAEDMADIEYLLRNNKNTLTILDGDGDFRSEECIGFLEEADIVVTNPPFSLFREYIGQLIKYDKKFLILGNMNSITYREVFSLIKQNLVWLGYKSMGQDALFHVSQELADYLIKNKKEGSGYKIIDGEVLGRASAIWYTNLDTTKRHDEIVLYKKYKEGDYPVYYNYDAINVDKVANIPDDYYKDIGVPITFLDKYNPDQFEVIGLGISNSGLEVGVKPYTKEHKEYRKNVQHRGAVDGDLYYLDKDGHPCVPYARILIRRRKNGK